MWIEYFTVNKLYNFFGWQSSQVVQASHRTGVTHTKQYLITYPQQKDVRSVVQ